MATTGGYTEAREASADDQATFNTAEVYAVVSEKLGVPVTSIEVLRVRTQVVAGLNFKAHAKAGDKEVIIQAFRPLPHTGEGLQVNSVTEGSEL